MKKAVFIALMSILVCNLQGQNSGKLKPSDLPSDVFSKVYADVEKALYNCCKNFDGVYKWGATTIDYITPMENTTKIEGKVSYKGSYCGNVTCDFYIMFNTQSGEATDRCINSPYCLMGSVLRTEWDCGCNKYLSTNSKLEVVTQYGPVLLKYLNSKGH
jgi:hypothetical protein